MSLVVLSLDLDSTLTPNQSCELLPTPEVANSPGNAISLYWIPQLCSRLFN